MARSRQEELAPPPVGDLPQVSQRRRAVNSTFGVQETSPVLRVRPDQVAPNPANPRGGMPQEELSELTESIRELGQVQPVTVMTRGAYLAVMPEYESSVGNAEYVVLTGSRRWYAAGAAGAEEFLVHVDDRPSTPEQILEYALVENVQRQDLEPLEEARALEKLVEVHGSGKAVAKRLGKSPGWVSQRLALLELTPELKSALVKGEMTVRDARAVGRKPASEQEAEWERRKQAVAAETAPATPERSTKQSAPAPSTPSETRADPSPPQGTQLVLDLEWEASRMGDRLAASLTIEQLTALTEDLLGRIGK